MPAAAFRSPLVWALLAGSLAVTTATGCATRHVPQQFTAGSALSAEAPTPPPPEVTVALRGDPPLPGATPLPGEGAAPPLAPVGRVLTADAAVRLALLNNRELRARLREIGVARGRLQQAGLVENPEIEIEKPPEPDTLLELRVEYDVTSLVLAPLRARAARAELEAVRYDVASSVVQTGAAVRAAFYAVAAAEQRLQVAQQALEAFAAGRDAAEALLEAGNIPPLDASTQIAAYERARVAVAQLELERVREREALNRLLGLHGTETEWSTAGELPAVPAALSLPDHVERRALTRSFAIASTRRRLEAIAERAGLARTEGWLPEISVAGLSAFGEGEPTGGASERHAADRSWRFGGGLSLSVPLFDRRQGTTRALDAEFDALLERYHGLAVDVRSRARELAAALRSAHARAKRYDDVIIPAQQQVMRETQLQYNAMQIGVFQLLEARRQLLQVELNRVEAQREFWTARAELDGALAGAPVSTSGVRGGEVLSGESASEGDH